MDINLQTGKKMKQACQLTALAAALALAGCGGGGGGFYGTTTGSTTTSTGSGTGTGTTAAVATNYHIVLSSSKANLVVSGDTVVITAKLLDANGGGISGQNIVLAIPDTQTNGAIINGASVGTTDATGTVTFTVNLPAATGTVASGLIANGLKVNATFTDATNKVTLQSTLVTVIPTPAVVSPATQDRLVISNSKASLLVTGDTATVSVKLLDPNGGGVSGQPVVLSIPNAIANGVSITGPSQVTTDATGTATFPVVLSGTSTNTAALLANGITVNATFTDTSNVTTTQTSILSVIQSQSVASPAAQDHLLINSAKSFLLSTGDSTMVTVKLVDNNGGAVAGQNVVLNIPSATISKGVSINGAASVTTDANGNATFVITLNGTTNANATALIASGINLTASFTDSTNTVASQAVLLSVAAPASITKTPLYHLVMSSTKPTLSSAGDSTIINVQALDANAGGAVGQTVVLSVPNALSEGISIKGPSSVVTDQFGNAQFTLILNTQGSTVNIPALIASGVAVDSAITDVNGNTAKQETVLNIFALPVPHFTLGRNAALATSSDGTYYYENFAANAVDGSGNPIPGLAVNMAAALKSFGKGHLNFVLDPSNGANISAPEWYAYTVNDYTVAPSTTAVPPTQSTTFDLAHFPFQNSFAGLVTATASGGPYYVTPNNTPTAASPGVGPFLYTYSTTGCVYTGQPFVQNAITFLQADGTPAAPSQITPTTSPTVGDSGATYVTDNSGAFTFRVRYLRSYALWQSLTLTASSTVSGTAVQVSMPYALNATEEDLKKSGGQPYTSSPYGQSSNCSNNQ